MTATGGMIDVAGCQLCLLKLEVVLNLSGMTD